jgi:hypothetical protein
MASMKGKPVGGDDEREGRLVATTVGDGEKLERNFEHDGS